MELRIITQEEFDAFSRDESGYKGCPTGDYTQIKRFGEGCSFGEQCSHEGLTNSVYFACDRIGSEKQKAYFFKADEGFFVRAGCFFGTEDEFIAQVKRRHGGTPHERHYLKALDLAKDILHSEDNPNN